MQADPDIKFDDLIENFRKEHFKAIKTMFNRNHFTSFHPLDNNKIITLVHGKYPQDMNYFRLQQRVKGTPIIETSKKDQQPTFKLQTPNDSLLLFENQNESFYNTEKGYHVDYTNLDFNMSHDGKYIFFFNIKEPEIIKNKSQTPIAFYQIDINTMELFHHHYIPEDKQAEIEEAALVYGSKILFTSTSSGEYRFIDTQTWDTLWSLNLPNEPLNQIFLPSFTEEKFIYLLSDVLNNKKGVMMKVPFGTKKEDIDPEKYKIWDQELNVVDSRQRYYFLPNKNFDRFIIQKEGACFIVRVGPDKKLPLVKVGGGNDNVFQMTPKFPFLQEEITLTGRDRYQHEQIINEIAPNMEIQHNFTYYHRKRGEIKFNSQKRELTFIGTTKSRGKGVKLVRPELKEYIESSSYASSESYANKIKTYISVLEIMCFLNVDKNESVLDRDNIQFLARDGNQLYSQTLIIQNKIFLTEQNQLFTKNSYKLSHGNQIQGQGFSVPFGENQQILYATREQNKNSVLNILDLTKRDDQGNLCSPIQIDLGIIRLQPIQTLKSDIVCFGPSYTNSFNYYYQSEGVVSEKYFLVGNQIVPLKQKNSGFEESFYPQYKYIRVPEPQSERDVKFFNLVHSEDLNKVFIYGDLKDSEHYSFYKNPLAINMRYHENDNLPDNNLLNGISNDQVHLDQSKGEKYENKIKAFDRYGKKQYEGRFIFAVNPAQALVKFGNKQVSDQVYKYHTFVDDNFFFVKNEKEKHIRFFDQQLNYSYYQNLYDENEIETQKNLELYYISDNRQYYMFKVDDQNNNPDKIFLKRDDDTMLRQDFYIYQLQYSFENNNVPFLQYHRKSQINVRASQLDELRQNYLKKAIVTNDGEFLYINLYLNSKEQFLDQEFNNAKNSQIQVQYDQNGLDFDQNFIKRFRNIYSENSTIQGFALINDNLFIVAEDKIEYLSLNAKQNDKSKRIKLNPSFQFKALRILGTQAENFIQIVVADDTKGFYIIGWDLALNKERGILQMTSTPERNDVDFIFRGNSQRMNFYLSSDNYIYDLNFNLPMSYVNNIDKSRSQLCSGIPNLTLLSQDTLKLLVQDGLILSATFADLVYWSHKLKNPTQIEILDVSKINLDYFRYRYFEGHNIFHQYALNTHIVGLVQQKIFEQLAEENTQNLPLLLYSLYPNDYAESPFQKAVTNMSSKNAEFMLQMITRSPFQNTSKFIKAHFLTLISMQLPAFDQYLEDTLSSPIRMTQTQQMVWNTDSNEQYFATNTSLIDKSQLLNENLELSNQSQTHLDQNLKIFVEEKVHVMVDERKMANTDKTTWFNELNLENQDQTSILKRAELKVLNFDWILDSNQAVDFLVTLSDSGDEKLFALQSVKAITLYFWNEYFYQIRNKVFFPFIVYLVFFQVYVTYIYEKNQQRISRNQDQQQLEDSTSSNQSTIETLYYFYELDKFFIAVIFALIGYFLVLEIIQMAKMKAKYFQTAWNFFDAASLMLNIAYIICSLSELNQQKLRPLGSVCVLIMWVKFFYFLRIFQLTASLIRIIIEICKDMAAFSFILMIAMIGFANSFYILAINVVSLSEAEEKFTGQNFLLAMIYSFRTGLGDFNTDGFGSTYNQIIWIIFLLEAILIQIILLNLLIAIMGDTFSKVTEISEQLKLQEISMIIADNQHILSNSERLTNGKYIVVASLESATNQAGSTWDGQVGALKSFVTQEKQKQKKVIQKIIKEHEQQLKSLEKANLQ
ncbi:wd-40 repeat protein [Stylonychia lemnae]|uniref:Wd-40 repeat protein n=1 Tax=Stylonychia lemnae TaxID=5949 RepID=A0A077ZUU3_STYLE|nr:wd-40 repeat protein [Stylonychia lemnae]|eukprot:CDW73669.1 wd-40 repeat protein [Stylonychia lemnae]